MHGRFIVLPSPTHEPPAVGDRVLGQVESRMLTRSPRELSVIRPNGIEPARPLVLHVVASGGAPRGGEVFASDLVRALRSDIGQVVVVIGGGSATVPYDAPVVEFLASRHPLPGVRMDAQVVWRLRRLLHHSRPDILQAHGGEALKYAVASTFGMNTSIVYRRIGPAIDRIARGARRAAYAGLMRRSRRVVAVAETLRWELTELFGLPPDHVITIPNGVDPARLVPAMDREGVRRSLGVPPDAPVAIFLGALTWEKDPMAMVQVARRLLTAEPSAWLLVVGDGPLKSMVRAAVSEGAFSGRVQVLGSRGDIADLLVSSDVLLFTSRSEGMPATVIEAAMLGVPTASFSVGGVPEVVEHGTTGLLAPPGEVARLAADALLLMRDAGLRQRMGRAARERSLARFDLRVIAPRYRALYEELAA